MGDAGVVEETSNVDSGVSRDRTKWKRQKKTNGELFKLLELYVYVLNEVHKERGCAVHECHTGVVSINTGQVT